MFHTYNTILIYNIKHFYLKKIPNSISYNLLSFSNYYLCIWFGTYPLFYF